MLSINLPIRISVSVSSLLLPISMSLTISSITRPAPVSSIFLISSLTASSGSENETFTNILSTISSPTRMSLILGTRAPCFNKNSSTSLKETTISVFPDISTNTTLSEISCSFIAANIVSCAFASSSSSTSINSNSRVNILRRLMSIPESFSVIMLYERVSRSAALLRSVLPQ